MAWFYFFIFIVSCFALVRSGLWMVQSLIRIAQFLKWREFIVASVLMAFSTSLPEVFVGITSALHQTPELSLGMIIGSNIIALTLVIGMGAMFGKELKFKGRTLKRSSIYAGIYGLLPLLLMLDGNISRADGIILFLSLGFYFFQLLSREERFTKVFLNRFKGNWVQFKSFLKSLAMFWAGTGLLLLSAEGIVFSSLKLAVSLNLSLVVIGALLVSIGTSLPELTFGIRSITMGHEDMILGNVMGSVVINSAFVLGLVALISPFEIVNFSPYLRGIIVTVATCFLFVTFARTDSKITKKEALLLLLIYVTFFLAEFFAK